MPTSHMNDRKEGTKNPGAQHDFVCSARPSKSKRAMQGKEIQEDVEYSRTSLWLGLAAKQRGDGSLELGFACHDGTYTMDSAIQVLQSDSDEVKTSQGIEHYIVERVRSYARENSYRFLGAGIAEGLSRLCSGLNTALWAELDIVPIVLQKDASFDDVDEVADSMARKCVMLFAPDHQLRLDIGRHNDVKPDLDGRARIASLAAFLGSATQKTQRATQIYAKALKDGNKKFAFFSATPRGGGVALMRHSLLRYYRLLGIDCSWWVPSPKPAVFRVTKTNHNILQGVAHPEDRFTKEGQQLVDDFGTSNAERSWIQDGLPLAPRSKGGADVIIVDDPQMPVLVSIAKKMDPERPVIFRSHIQMRSELIADRSSQANAVWQWIWSHVQKADVFVAHPISKFVPEDVPREKVAYMPATTDWLDGLNKTLCDETLRFYLHEFNSLCRTANCTTLAYPKRDYIIQVARFDPSKGFDDALAAYADFRRTSAFCKGKPSDQTPQLVLCGHSSVDDPDGTAVFNDVVSALQSDYSDLKDSVIAMRLGPSDQMLNTLLSCSKVALQLSSSEGFEIKVSEALHKGVPVIATENGGLPLQIAHGKSGFLVGAQEKRERVREVAGCLQTLFEDEKRYKEMSGYAKRNISDEVGTVGNAVCWMYLVDRLASGKALKPNGAWIWDLAREQAGEACGKDESRLPRNLTTYTSD